MYALASVVDRLPRRVESDTAPFWRGPDADRVVDLVSRASARNPGLAEDLRRGARLLGAAAVEQRRASRADPSFVVTLDIPAAGGRLLQRVGPPDAAVLVVLVPGVGTDRGDRARLRRDAERLWLAAADRVDLTDSVAVVAWLGYDPPDVAVGAIDVGPAAEGARSLTAWVATARRAGVRRVTLVGHSYGGVLVGRAAAGGAAVDAVVQLGSPGSGSPGAVAEMSARGVEVRAVRAPGDPIGLVAGRLPGLFGEDAVGVVDDLPTDARGHSGYLSDPALLDAVAALAVGSRSSSRVR